MATLAEIRAKLLAQENKAETKSNQSRGTDAIYPFWNMENDSTATIRFLPDADSSNVFFWRERQVVQLKRLTKSSSANALCCLGTEFRRHENEKCSDREGTYFRGL